jgi:uncharacterized coiled-coil protein SlyX
MIYTRYSLCCDEDGRFSILEERITESFGTLRAISSRFVQEKMTYEEAQGRMRKLCTAR